MVAAGTRPIGEARGDSMLDVGNGAPSHYVSAFTGESIEATKGQILLRHLFARFPTAIATSRA